MWYGKTTEELKKLNEEYYKLFGGYPFGHMELSEYKKTTNRIRPVVSNLQILLMVS